jgi:Mg-chelatase subunit ChlD
MYQRPKRQTIDPLRPLRMMVRRLETSNSILAGRNLYHHLVPKGEAPAWTLGNDIYFNSGKLPSPVDKLSTMAVKGFSNHELGHVMFSPTAADIQHGYPGAGNEMYSAMLYDKSYQLVFNALEDQRMETLLCRRFANQAPYLTAAFRHSVMSGSDQMLERAYLLARGRRYLPVRLRRLLRRKFPRQDLIPDIRRIIDGYCRLNLYKPQDLYKAHRFIVEMVDLLRAADILPEVQDFCLCKTLQDRNTTPDRQESADAVERILAKVHRVDGEVQDSAEDAPDADVDGTDDADAQSSLGGAGQPPEDAAQIGKQVKDILTGIVEQDAATGDVADELRAIEKFIRDGVDIVSSQLEATNSLDPQMLGLAKKVADALQVQEEDTEASWERWTNSGKLNVGRVIAHPNDRDHAFDRWREGGDTGVDQEWVVILDCSGSMKSYFNQLSQAAWIAKRAADAVGVRMTVFAFGYQYQTHLVYGPDDKVRTDAYKSLGDLGMTEPLKALVEAHQLLSRSPRKERVMFLMTDGGFTGTSSYLNWRDPEEVIEDMNARDISTHLMYYDTQGNGTYDSHRCKTHGLINSLYEFPGIVKDLMMERIRIRR